LLRVIVVGCHSTLSSHAIGLVFDIQCWCRSIWEMVEMFRFEVVKREQKYFPQFHTIIILIFAFFRLHNSTSLNFLSNVNHHDTRMRVKWKEICRTTMKILFLLSCRVRDVKYIRLNNILNSQNLLCDDFFSHSFIHFRGCFEQFRVLLRVEVDDENLL
jgi:hypothetical protein